MLDLGMLMYAGLLVLAVWRSICFYRCCGLWLSFLSYASLLYVILVASLTYSLVCFYQLTQKNLDPVAIPYANLWSISWLQPLVMGAPALVAVSLALGWVQSEGHVFEIHKDVGATRHDRAVQIIALPAVFGVMAVASMVPVYELVTGYTDPNMLINPLGLDARPGVAGMTGSMGVVHYSNASSFVASNPLAYTAQFEELKQLAFWRYETCFYVADLFEAWALYQFGILALELIGDSIAKKQKTFSSLAEGEVQVTAAMEDLVASHVAMTNLTWLGTSIFVLVCVVQTACSLYPYLAGTVEGQAHIMQHFQVAGFVASGAAIYNLLIVERAFHRHLEPASPLLKFLSVKILVSLSFFQRGLILVLQGCERLLPEVMRDIVKRVPLVGDIVNLTEVQMHLFYPSLILVECLLASVMHVWAWRSDEAWYADGYAGSETTPLLSHSESKLDVKAEAKGVAAAEEAVKV
mmetsp:Transcript_68649/g.147051  ORF Transcript_68649/g.147051 Transcript_68649/m.147051 type:complete len:465 (-) Transcript_68649:39-1433(-)